MIFADLGVEVPPSRVTLALARTQTLAQGLSPR